MTSKLFNCKIVSCSKVQLVTQLSHLGKLSYIITKEPSFKHDLEEYKMALQTMNQTSEAAVNFVFKFTSSKVYDKMKTKVTGTYSKSLIYTWKKSGEYQESLMPSPLTTQYY